MRAALAIPVALTLHACASVPEATPLAEVKALFVGKVESSEYVMSLGDVMPNDGNSLWLGEVYEVKMKVLDRLSGGPVGSTVTVKLTAHARDFKDMTLTVLTSPNLAFYGVDIGASWWEDLSPESPTLCVPGALLDDEAFATYVARAKPMGDSHCLDIR